MEGYCWTGQSPQRAVVPMEDEKEEFLHLPTIIKHVNVASVGQF
jgi:hypothetical protein